MIDRLLARWLQHFIRVHFLYPVLLFYRRLGFLQVPLKTFPPLSS